MPKLKQKAAADLPEFIKEDAPKIKRNKRKTKLIIAQPEVVQPEIAKPEVVKPEIAESAVIQPVITQPVITQPEIRKTEIMEPAIIQPVMAQSEIAKPEIEKSSIFKPVIMPEKNQKLNWDIWKKIITGVVLAILIILSAATFYFYHQWRQTKTNPQEVAKSALSEIVADVGHLIELPADEVPTMATVTSVEKLKDQPFFAKAQNGDKALIYSKAGKAILYRPESDKIIEVISLVGSSQLASGQISPNSQSPAVNSEAVQTPTDIQTPVAEIPAKVAVYNGGNINGLAQRIGDKVALISGVAVSEKANAQGNYEKTLVIDLSGNQGELAQKIAETLGGEVGTLPEGETKPEADILVIAAKG